MRLAQRDPSRSPISLVAMIDVLMIMLVFFMVTSTYLDLDMIPVAESREAPPAAAPGGGAGSARLLIRLGADGRAHVQGQSYAAEEIGTAIAARLAEAPGLEVIVLPSGGAAVQALVSVMDAAVAAGAERVRIVRLEASP